jgi:hypothetical protein
MRVRECDFRKFDLDKAIAGLSNGLLRVATIGPSPDRKGGLSSFVWRSLLSPSLSTNPRGLPAWGPRLVGLVASSAPKPTPG